MKHTDPWLSGRPEHPDPNRRWDDGGRVAMDAHGEVTRIEPGQVARKFVLGSNTHFHPGRYTVLFRGRGRLDYRGSVTNLVRGRDRDTFDLAPGEGLWLELHSIDASEPLRDVHIIPPGGRCENDVRRYCTADAACGEARCVPFTENYRDQPFHPEFLADIAFARVLRFMDWMDTNRLAEPDPTERVAPPVRSMDQWTELADVSHHPVPFETIIALANTAHADAWVTIPHEVDDAFVRALATRLRDTLDPSLRVFVEYSNEVWNGMFGQAHYANREGCRLYSSNPRECDEDGDGVLCESGPWSVFAERCFGYGRRFYAKRTVEIMRIFESVFARATSTRVVRVLAWQTGSVSNAGLEMLRMDVGGEPVSAHVDVFGVAPYFGGGYRHMPPANEFFARVRRETFGAPAGTFRVLASSHDGREAGPYAAIVEDARALRETPGLSHIRLVAYEGGQHLFSFEQGQGEGIRALNLDPRMGELYLQYLALFDAHTNGTLFVHYSSPGSWWQHGAFGSKEWQGQPSSEAPKHHALEAFAARTRPAR